MTSPARGRVGRPPRIDRAAIARAAAEIPMQELTLRSVAERLGVSVPSLYHYVRGRDDLIRMAATESALRLSIPADQGQHWAVWLYEWAVYTGSSFASDPELLKHFIDGAIGPEVMAVNVDAAMGVCMDQGFTASEAREAYQLVSECALGAAIGAIRDRRAAEDGAPFDLAVRSLIAQGSELPHLAELIRAADFAGHVPFRRQIITVLAGIAALRGEPWAPIEALLPRPDAAGAEVAGSEIAGLGAAGPETAG
jgi:AcrR family transcriptional regulator